MKYGFGTRDPSTVATQTTAPVAATSAGVYSWSPARLKAFVVNELDSGQKLYGKWNSDTCTTTDWDFSLDPGDVAVFPDIVGEAMVKKVAIYLPVAMTWLTNYMIRGWD